MDNQRFESRIQSKRIEVLNCDFNLRELGLRIVPSMKVSNLKCRFNLTSMSTDCYTWSTCLVFSICRKCCAEDSDDSTSKITYAGPVLEVCMRKLVFYPDIVGFIEDDKEKFPSVKVQYAFNAPPKLIMLDAGQHKEIIRHTEAGNKVIAIEARVIATVQTMTEAVSYIPGPSPRRSLSPRRTTTRGRSPVLIAAADHQVVVLHQMVTTLILGAFHCIVLMRDLPSSVAQVVH